MSRFDITVEIIHDLLHIQQERANTYEKFMRYPDQDETVCKFLRGVAVQSRNCLLELRGHVDINCGDPADRVEVKGEIYREWPGIKYFPPNSSPQEVYLYCEYNELETVRAYQRAIASEQLCEEIRQVLSEQLKRLRLTFQTLYKSREEPAAPMASRPDDRMPFTFTRSEGVADLIPV